MANDADVRWLRVEIGSGLQRLFVLRLSGGPFTDQELVALAEVWFEALMDHPVKWDEKLDRPRVNRAFRSLIKSSDRWPSPKHFFDALGVRSPVEMKEIGRENLSPREVQKRRDGMVQLDQIIKKFGFNKE